MAESTDSNGVYVDHEQQEDQQKPPPPPLQQRRRKHGLVTTETLPEVLNRLVTDILFPGPADDASLLRRIKASVAGNAPLLPEASRNSASHVIVWTRRGSPLRALLVISVGAVTFVALTGLLVFMLFFLAATINAVVISLLMSLAAAGGFLALFFALATAIYIGALSVAIFVISFTAFWTIVAVLITAGWMGFFYTVWLITRKSLGLAKHSLSVTSSAISTYTTARHARHQIHKDSD
ncbi:uncharacterized protein LOC130724383 [Lotus japonicus]|uniref:uncharacterized protein LOC130724383 n=1 Tax=Lotus japonicus TaxID=34305 RepID=UPI00258F3810|nr:uncharacterized protein LOC130724383 [Lotus japonicus]XP_057431584.1 uncharacterized protein LOC130724383 [Lotus japonicus]XP_057431585.1 uncharacterized protein LOC130724383 [Lotus japonicus]